MSSGYTFPLPWYLVPANFLIHLYTIFLMFNPLLKKILQARSEKGLTGLPPSFEAASNGIPVFCPALPELDYPLFVPSNVKCCGPIISEVQPLAVTEPELETWLQKRRTILVNMGSHVESDANDARELASGLRFVLDSQRDLQVLWKLKYKGPLDSIISQILAPELADGRVKIETWLTADPVSILQTGHIACSVHHGGANSFYEAIW